MSDEKFGKKVNEPSTRAKSIRDWAMDITLENLEKMLGGKSEMIDKYLDMVRVSWVDYAGSSPNESRCGHFFLEERQGHVCLIFYPRAWGIKSEIFEEVVPFDGEEEPKYWPVKK